MKVLSPVLINRLRLKIRIRIKSTKNPTPNNPLGPIGMFLENCSVDKTVGKKSRN